MAKTATTRYDVADHLRTPEERAAYFEASLEEAGRDAALVAKALGDIARAKGMTDVARDSGLSRESLYKALSGERVPNFDTILKIITALGLKLRVEACVTSQEGPAQQRERLQEDVAQLPETEFRQFTAWLQGFAEGNQVEEERSLGESEKMAAVVAEAVTPYKGQGEAKGAESDSAHSSRPVHPAKTRAE